MIPPVVSKHFSSLKGLRLIDALSILPAAIPIAENILNKKKFCYFFYEEKANETSMFTGKISISLTNVIIVTFGRAESSQVYLIRLICTVVDAPPLDGLDIAIS
jgi:hypothetical protein